MNPPSTPAAPGRPDEHTLVMPDTWRRQLHPRRGGHVPGTVPEPVIDPGATSLELRIAVEEALNDPASEPELAGRGLAHLRGAPEPLGAAVVGTVTLATPHVQNGVTRYQEDGLERLIDGWVAEHGVVFAACASAEFTAVAPVFGERRRVQAVKHAAAGERGYYWWMNRKVIRRLRTRLAVAGERDHQEAVERLAHCRRTPLQRLVVSYLVPTRSDWVDECCASAAPARDAGEAWLLLCALGSAHQLGLIGGRVPIAWDGCHLDVVSTLVEGVGPAATPLLAAALDADVGGRDGRRMLLDVLAQLPTDEAFQILVDRIDQNHVQPALQGAMKRYPVRALRLLAPATGGTSKKTGLAAGLLRAHLITHAELTEAVLPELPAEARTAIEPIRAAAAVRVPDAPAEALPPLLVTPPWTRTRRASRAVVIEGLTPPAERSLRWTPGEREEWAKVVYPYWAHRTDVDWAAEVERYRSGRTSWYWASALFAEAPMDLVGPLFPSWNPRDFWDADRWVRPVVARFGVDALPTALAAARANPAGNGGLLLPFLDTEVALLAAEWLMRLKSGRRFALAWFERHKREAVPRLLPAALGKTGPGRRNAEGALRLLAARLGADEVVAAARAYGDEAAEAIAAMLAVDPLEVLPARMPSIGRWADPGLLPQLLLRDRAHALPIAATGHLLAMLAISKPGDAYAGVNVVRELCDPGSMAEFAWALFQSWQAAGAPSKESWALTQLGWLGDDETVRRLAPLIRVWPGEGGHAKAVSGLDVLAAIGSDVALMHLHGIAQKVKFGGLKTRAREKIEQVAAELELTPEQLADRLVPDFGLDAGGGMTLDYGPRRFVVGFDEQLKPYVAEEDGKRRANLPKPGVKDDPRLAPDAYKRFAGLKKDVRTAAADQIRRMEAAMVTRRRWTMREFGELFVRHPLLWHVTRRLVWVAEDGGEATAFRIAEDRTFADADDDVLTPPDSARVGIAHPLHLGDALAGWSELFADYEILQPFPQLGRAVYALTEQERASGRLTRFEGVKVPVGKVLGLERRGWRRGEPQDAGIQCWMSREVAAGRYVVIDLNPGVAIGAIGVLPEQTIEYVSVSGQVTGYWPSRDTEHTFADLDPVMASEVLADLTEMAGPTG